MNEPETSGTAELLRLISDHAADLSLIILDTSGTITSWAGGAEDIEGYAPQELLGKHFSIFMSPDDREAGLAERLLKRAAEHGHIEVEGWRVRRDGTRYWANILTSAIRDLDGRLIGFVRVVRDLSKRQRALDMLRESEERHRHLVENATDVIYTHDLDGHMLSVNAAAEKLLGLSREEIIGRSIFDVVTPEFHERVSAMITQKLEAGGSTTHALDVVARDGREVSLEVSTQLIYEHGQPVGVQGVARDITERKRASEMLERSERYFRTLIENASEAITIINGDGTIRYSSPALERLLGYTPDERRGRSFLELVHMHDAERARSLLSRLHGEPDVTLQAQLRIRHNDRSWRHIDLSARNLLADPNVGGIVVNWRDVTPQVQVEERLIEREHFFRSIIERSTDVLIVLDRDQTIRYVSPAGKALSGNDDQTVIGTSGLELVHPDDVVKCLDSLTNVYERAAPTARLVVRIRSAQGEYRVFDVRARNLLNDPLFEGVVLDARDVTDSKRTEEALRASEERFRTIVENSSEGILIIDAGGFITFLNDRYAAMLGYHPSELLGKSALAAVTEADQGALPDSTARRLVSGESEQLDLTMARKDGTAISVIVSVSPLFDSQQKYVGSVALFTEITERKQLEAQLRTSQKIEAVGQLAGGVAHDFNNLLTAIRGHVELLLAEVPPDAAYRGDIDEIRKGADRAAALTQQLLAFSRRQILQPRVLEVDEVVAGVDTLLRRLIGEHITLSTTLGAGTSCVHADRGRLEQILMNLAVNARDAMPKGGQLSIGTRVVTIGDEFVRANPGSRAGRFVQLDIVDTGQGMSEDTMSHLFEPFFTTKSLGRGTGLGLATVYGIVKQSNGYIRVESQPGVGTRFEVLLPLVDAMPEPAREAAQVPMVRNATVLVAEDEDAVRSLACRVLRKQGFQVLEASNGVQAIEVALKHEGHIDLLLSDIVMPQMGGRELVEKLVRVRPDLKVVFMSGYTSDALLQRGVADTGGGFLEKPFTPNALVAKIREVLSSA